MDDNIFLYANLSKILINEGESKLRQFIVLSSHSTEEDAEESPKLIKKIDNFIAGHSDRYKKKCKHNLALFTKKYASWLEQQFIAITNESTADQNNNLENSERTNGSEPGQRKSFSECSEKVKRKTCETLRNQADPAAIERAYIDNLRCSDKKLDANIITKLDEAAPAMKKRIFEILSSDQRKMVPYSPDEALALMIDLRQSKEDYHEMHMGAKNREANIYPSYHKVLEATKRCYPSSIAISEVGAQINLQVLLDHTSSRIMQVIRICDLTDISNQSELNFKFIAKWEMDGASGQSIYKQVFQARDKASSDDSSIFMTSIVPLQLESPTEIIWLNPRSSSTKYCRPISFEFIKESEISTVQQHRKIRSQIDKLLPFTITRNKITVHISYEMELTMIDGKTGNYVTSNPSQQTCNICGATPTVMNNLKLIQKKTCKTENYTLGLSTLHCWIRFLECILHIAYGLPFRKWAAKGEKYQSIVEDTKRKIQVAYKAKKALDIVRQGSGTSNDGNTARRFFDDPKFAAQTTGVDEQLIHRFKVILVTLCCGQNVDPARFKKYAFETAELFVSLYDWFYMPASVHKVLIHGADVIKTLHLPIGMYSEEAQEARNKEFKWFREHNTRKMSRSTTNEDLIHALLVSSDPVISNLRREKSKIHKELDPEVVDLLSENQFYSKT